MNLFFTSKTSNMLGIIILKFQLFLYKSYYKNHILFVKKSGLVTLLNICQFVIFDVLHEKKIYFYFVIMPNLKKLATSVNNIVKAKFI